MACHLHGVYPYRGLLIHRAEMQQNALARVFLRHRHLAAVPQILAAFQLPLHTGKRRLRGKGHDDLPVKLGGVTAGAVYRIIPLAVETAPAPARKLGPGVLRQRIVKVYAVRPIGFHVRLLRKGYFLSILYLKR